MAGDFRVEKDSMGEMKVPSHFLYGASTQRAVLNFPVSDLKFGRDFIRVLALIKASAAEVNRSLGLIDGKLADAILAASREIAEGAHDEHFVVDIFQTGSGTSTNMNFNEVAANLANRQLGAPSGKKLVHPNDHVNMGQSSNDVIPTAIHVAAALAVSERLIPALEELRASLGKKAAQFKDIVKTGRTHLQDATPVTMGQVFSGYETQVKKAITRAKASLGALCELAIGGTAVGTGINTHAEFGEKVAASLSKKLGLPFKEAENHFEAQAAKDGCVEASGLLKTIAISLTKIANDIRWLGSGPRAGLAELKLPEVQPGSSIMPGKVNPVIPESLLQVCAQVIGNDATVTWGAGFGSTFELNVMMPVIAHNLLQSITLLASAVRMFDTTCIRGIEADVKRIEATVEQGLMLATALAPAVGYDKAAELAKKAYKEGKTIREIAMTETDLGAEKLKALLDPRKMLSGSVAGSGG